MNKKKKVEISNIDQLIPSKPPIDLGIDALIAKHNPVAHKPKNDMQNLMETETQDMGAKVK